MHDHPQDTKKMQVPWLLRGGWEIPAPWVTLLSLKETFLLKDHFLTSGFSQHHLCKKSSITSYWTALALTPHSPRLHTEAVLLDWVREVVRPPGKGRLTASGQGVANLDEGSRA